MPASANRTVLCIFSQWFSGSSILNLLLDQQQDVRGLGECYHIYNGNKECYCSCDRRLPNCSVFGGMEADRFYERCFERYACSVIVDSSKSWENIRVAYDPSIATRGVLLSKKPHAWLFSRRGHRPDLPSDPLRCFREYMWFYADIIRACDEKDIPLQPVTYKELTTDTLPTLRRILVPVNIDVDQDTVQGPWTTDTHIAGGNASVYHQLQPQTDFFDTARKYKDKKGELFFDESWKEDRDFRVHCAAAYRSLADEMGPLLAELGQPSAAELAEEVDILPVARWMTVA